MSKLFAVIMAGGAGTRFWPASRHQRPKQLLPLTGSEEPLIAATLRRILPLLPPERVLIATGRHLVEASRSALPQIPAENFLAEPMARNTAACIGWAAATIRRRDPEALVMVLPADHHIEDEEAFRSVLLRAIQAAEKGAIATIGIEPTRPETGFGYIERGEDLGGGAYRVVRFIEKPPLQDAERYAQSGEHLWNGGMFFFRVNSILQEIGHNLPDLAQALEELDRAAEEGREGEILDDAFAKMPSISIDHGVMEKAESLAVVPGSFGFSDIGSWQSAWELAKKDADGNAASGDDILIDARGNLIADLRHRRDGHIVALVGIDNLVVVQTDDALLIMPKERSQDVRGVVEALKSRQKTELL